MNRVILLTGLVLSIAVLATGTIVQSAEAAPLKDTMTNDGVVFSCSANNGILTCVAKSESGGNVDGLTMTDPSKNPNVCDNNDNERKRLSVTNRKSVNCGPFVDGEIFTVKVAMVDGAPYTGNPICVNHNSDNITLAEAPGTSIMDCL